MWKAPMTLIASHRHFPHQNYLTKTKKKFKFKHILDRINAYDIVGYFCEVIVFLFVF